MSEKITGIKYNSVGIELFDNVGEGDGCYNCVTFSGSYLYCQILDLILRSSIPFDENGTNNRCELFTKLSPLVKEVK